MAKGSKSVGQRDRFTVTIFADEYEGLGIDPRMSYGEATAVVRAKAGVAVPMRRKQTGAGVSALAKAIRDAPEDKRKEIMQLLTRKE